MYASDTTHPPLIQRPVESHTHGHGPSSDETVRMYSGEVCAPQLEKYCIARTNHRLEAHSLLSGTSLPSERTLFVAVSSV
jgi:hypothetical protein